MVLLGIGFEKDLTWKETLIEHVKGVLNGKKIKMIPAPQD